MAIERGVDDIDKADLGIEDNSKEIEVDVEPEVDKYFAGIDDSQNEILEDGTMLVGMPPAPMMEQGGDFFENLAQVIDDSDLGSIYSDCMSDYEDDRSSRKEWEEQYKEGLEFLGMK